MKFIETRLGEVMIASNKLGLVIGNFYIEKLMDLDYFELLKEVGSRFYDGVMLEDVGFSYKIVEGNQVKVMLTIDPNKALFRVLDNKDKADKEKISNMLKANYGLDEFELSHAISAAEAEYENEIVIPMGLREMRVPAHPLECNYVRFCVDGVELSYWAAEEWATAPAEVMGAIIGSIKMSMESKQESRF